MRIKKLSKAKEVVDCYTNSPCQHLRECMENSMERILLLMLECKGLRNDFIFLHCKIHVWAWSQKMRCRRRNWRKKECTPDRKVAMQSQLVINVSWPWRKTAKAIKESSMAKWLERWLCNPEVARSSVGRAY